MKVTKNFKGLKDLGWVYELDGDLISHDSLEIDLGRKRLRVTGSIMVRTFIEAKGSIEADENIEVDGNVEVRGSLEVGGILDVGGNVYVNLTVKAKEFRVRGNIKARQVKGKVIYGRIRLFA